MVEISKSRQTERLSFGSWLLHRTRGTKKQFGLVSAGRKEFCPAVDISTIWFKHYKILFTEAEAAHSCCGVEGAGLNKLFKL